MKKLEDREKEYIFRLISQNIKKYRKIKGFTQEQLAEKIDASLNFIGKIEAKKSAGLSIDTLFLISKALDIELYKFFIDEYNDDLYIFPKYVKYKCKKCGLVSKMPIELVKLFHSINKITNNNNLPSFECTNCDGRLYPLNITEL